MTLLERLRAPRPAWQNPDAGLRAEAVRQIPGHDQTLLAEIARTDADARVRRAALRKLNDPRTLAEVLAGEVDAETREEAGEALMSWAAGEDGTAAQVALGALSDPRRLAHLARAARLAEVRHAALARLEDPRLLVTLAKLADDPTVRTHALARLSEPASIVEVAAKTEHKDVAIAAVDRIGDVAALRQIAERARHKAASRRALLRLAERRPQLPIDTAPVPVEPAASPGAALEEKGEPAQAIESAAAIALEREPLEHDADAAAVEPVASVANPEPARPVEDALTAEPAAPARAGSAVDDAGAASAAREEDRRAQLARATAFHERLLSLARDPDLALKDAEVALREARPWLAGGSAALPGRLHHRIKEARNTLFARAQELRDADEWSRWGNAAVQEELCARMEALLARDDFDRVAHELHEADARWARFRYAPKDQAEALRQRYQTARGQVKARLDDHFARKAAEEKRHLEEKRALCEQAEQWAESTEWLKASEELKGLQARWKGVGPVPHRQSEALWQRFRAACDRFFSRRHDDLRQRKAAWAANLARKEELCARAEALAPSSDWEAAAAELKRLQTEWKSVGPVRRAKTEAVWRRFRTACDAFFERYKSRDALELAEKAAQREALCGELEALLPGEGREPASAEALFATLQSAQARWRQAPRLPSEAAAAFERRFGDLRARLIASRPDAFRGTELDLDAARARKEKLCARVEALLGQAAVPHAELSGEALARRLKEALATNTIGGAEQAEARRRAELEEVEAARAAWLRLPALTGDAGEALERRFADACARFPRERRPEPERPRVNPRGKPARTSRASRTP